MIIDAGYPDGLTVSVDYCPDTEGATDIVALLEDMWSKIGVTTILKPHDYAILSGIWNSGDWESGLLDRGGNAKTTSALESIRNTPTRAVYGDEYFNEAVDRVSAMKDPIERNALLKELAEYLIPLADTIGGGNPYYLRCYWPWVKNYYGEIETGYINYAPMLATLWIDQDLKAEMGF